MILAVIVATAGVDVEGDRLLGTVKDDIHLLFTHLLKRLVDIDMIMVKQYLELLPLQIGGIDDILVVTDATLSNGKGIIRYEQIGIDALGYAQTLAGRTGTKRRIEREKARFQFRYAEATDRAGIVGGKKPVFIASLDIGDIISDL